MALSCFVVFVTTYMLILPAITLDQEEAARQGGIDVPAVHQTENAVQLAAAGEAKSPSRSVDDLAHNKKLKPNTAENGEWDGTYTLSLDIVGKRSSSESANVNKADIILVLDMSSSMIEAAGDGTRYSAEMGAVRTLGKELLSFNTAAAPDTVTMSVMTFGNHASEPQVVQATDYPTFEAGLNTIPMPPEGKITEGGQGTNWEAALSRANEIPTRDGVTPMVIFISDGLPTLRDTPDDPHSFEQFYYRIVGAYGPGTDVAEGIFGGNQELFDRLVNKCYDNAKDEAKAIVDAGKEFYTISVFDTIPRMENLAAYAYSGDDNSTCPDGHYEAASDAEDLLQFFNFLIETTANSIQYQNVKITDTLTAAAKSALQIDGHANDFRYYKNGVEWTDAPGASYNNGTVEWDLGEDPLEDGVTYTVEFTVWPNQDAYDAILKLNEGEATLEDIQRDYPDVAANLTEENGKYRIYSNGDATVSYDKITTIDGVQQPVESKTLEYPRPTMETLQYRMKVAKVWKDSLYDSNRPDSIKFNIYEDGKFYKQVTLTSAEAVSEDRWETEIPISPGIISNKIIDGIRLNEGHVYTVEEALDEGETSDYHYDFDPEELTPILDDGTMHFLGDEDGDESLSGTNHMRGSMTITKKVTDANGRDISSDEAVAGQDFTFRVYLKDSNGQEITGRTTEDEDAIWYRLLDENGEETGEATVINSGDTFTLKAGHSLRLLNLPRTMSYKVEEINIPDGYELADEEYDSVSESSDTEVELTPDEDGYCIAQPNTWQYVTVTNKQQDVPVNGSLIIRKSISENGSEDVSDAVKQKLEGTYTFTLYTDAQCTQEYNGPDGTAVTATVAIGADGAQSVSEEITDLPPGDYWVKETLPSNDSLPVVNPVKVTVEEGKTGDAAAIADFANNYETTDITVKKQWSDTTPVDHTSDTITFGLYQVAEDSEGNVLREGEYSGAYTNTITGTGEVTIEGLPVRGTVGGTEVTYHYYVSELSWPAGYVPVVGHSDTADGQEWTLNNVGPQPPDTTTSIDVTKIWKDQNGNDVTASGHDDDVITFKLTQTAAESEYVPVTLMLYNSDESMYSNKTYYVRKNGDFVLSVKKPATAVVRTSVSVNTDDNRSFSWPGSWAAGHQSGSTSFAFDNITSALRITAYLSGGRNTRWASEAINIPGEATYWSHSVSGTDLKTDVGEVIAAADGSDAAATQDYIYTMHKDQLEGAYTPSAAGWAGTIENLPLYKMIDNSTFYVYSYKIDEVSVNGKTVIDKSTTDGIITGHTDEYDVEVNQATNTITNTESNFDLEILKVDKTDNSKKLENATFTLQKIKSNKAPGNEVKYDGDILATKTTDKDGKAVFEGLSGGYYEVKESQTPAGYIISGDDAFYIKVSKDGVQLIQCDLTRPAREWNVISSGGIVSAFAAAGNGSPAQATVANEPGVELPNSGGPGTTWIYLIGSILLLGCGVALVTRRRMYR